MSVFLFSFSKLLMLLHISDGYRGRKERMAHVGGRCSGSRGQGLGLRRGHRSAEARGRKDRHIPVPSARLLKASPLGDRPGGRKGTPLRGNSCAWEASADQVESWRRWTMTWDCCQPRETEWLSYPQVWLLVVIMEQKQGTGSQLDFLGGKWKNTTFLVIWVIVCKFKSNTERSWVLREILRSCLLIRVSSLFSAM